MRCVSVEFYANLCSPGIINELHAILLNSTLEEFRQFVAVIYNKSTSRGTVPEQQTSVEKDRK